MGSVVSNHRKILHQCDPWFHCFYVRPKHVRNIEWFVQMQCLNCVHKFGVIIKFQNAILCFGSFWWRHLSSARTSHTLPAPKPCYIPRVRRNEQTLN